MTEKIMVKPFQRRWQTIADLIKKHNCKNIAEIGVLDGENAENILNLCPKIEQYFLIDHYVDPSGRDKWHINREFYYGCVDKPTSFIKLPSEEAVRFFKDESLDLVFIDANHKYEFVKMDIELWSPKVKKGGIICGHDYNWPKSYPGVQKAVDEKFERVYYIPDEVPNKYRGVWWVEK